ncbi:MAG TPA: hypothetical protein VF831_06505, partial [Anaerolineales bacterium]
LTREGKGPQSLLCQSNCPCASNNTYARLHSLSLAFARFRSPSLAFARYRSLSLAIYLCELTWNP